MEIFDVIIPNSTAVYEIETSACSSFFDVNGNPVPAPQEPIKYELRSWCQNVPSWVI